MKKILLIIYLLAGSYGLFAQAVVGNPAPDFSMPDTNGVYHSLGDFSGQIIVLNFFASWCGPCQIESPLLEDSIWQVYQNQGVTVIGASVGDSLWQIRNFVNLTGITYPILRDRDFAVFNDYGFLAFPSNAIINRQGIVVHLETGFNIPRFVRIVDSLVSITGIAESPPTGQLPRTLTLLGPYPNPFNSQVKIRFQLARTNPVKLTVYNTTGQQIWSRSAVFPAGRQEFALNLNRQASGIYLFTLQAGAERETGKFVLQK